MNLLPNYFRDFLNLKIEQDRHLWDTLKRFKESSIQIKFIDEPLKGTFFSCKIDADGLIGATQLRISKITNKKNSEITGEEADIVIYLDNKYLFKISSEFVGWSLDYENKDLPDSSFFSSGLKINGDASALQQLEPLLKLIIQSSSPYISFIKNPPLSTLIQNFVENVLRNDKIILLDKDFRNFTKGVRNLRSNIDRTEKKFEILQQKNIT
ncbi:MAG: hypothetical protein CBD16_07960 [Betaproteobacteria bacterium TMED156]|nr:MAG: hypothetical protein CBD16_07960 [Betaproteobacteria bacterium TMED156]